MLKYVKCAFVAAGFYFSSLLLADSPEPYNSIHLLPFTTYNLGDAYILGSFVSSNSSAILVDVESQDGGAARYLAQQSFPSVTKIYAVNSWSSLDPNQTGLFQQFLSNVIQENTTGAITPIRMNSLEAAQALNVLADFIYLGANDEETVYANILAWVAHLSSKGIICGNNWFNNSVKVGVTRAANQLDLVLRINDNVWSLQRL